jgi:PAS domain S-box-containing protein
MVRYSLFEARILVSRTLTIVLMVLVLSIVQIAMQRAFQAVLGMELSVLISLSVIGFLLFGTPLSRKVRSLIDTLVIGDNYSYQERLRESVHASSRRGTGPFALYVETIKDTLGVANAGAVSPEDGRGWRHAYRIGTFETMTNSRTPSPIAVKRMVETKRRCVRGELEIMSDDEKMLTLMTYLRGIGADVLIPLFYQGMLRGALALGSREDGETYGQSDIDLLEATARQAAVAMENAHLLDLARSVRSSLQESEERFHAIARILPTAIFIHQGGQIKYANTAAETLTGYTASELMNMNFWDLIHPNYRYHMREHRTHDQNMPWLLPYSELKMIKNTGEERWVVMTASLIEYGERMARL